MQLRKTGCGRLFMILQEIMWGKSKFFNKNGIEDYFVQHKTI